MNYCSYRTYEEWKQQTNNYGDAYDDSSYRTYEEWKLFLRVYKFLI